MESLGNTLKSLREEKGMTLADVSKATKIRTSILSALENEEWDNLPQKIFIKGFVRAYVQAVEGDEALIMDLFESSCPVKDAQISCPTFETEPVRSLVREKRSYKWVFVLILLILIAGGAYLFFQKYYPQFRETADTTVKEETTVVTPGKTEKELPLASSPQNPAEETQTTTSEKAPETTGAAPSVVTTMGTSPTEPEEKMKTPVQDNNTTVPSVSAEKAATSSQTENPGASATPTTSEKSPDKVSSDNLIITAKMETWIGLKIDGKTRKEILLKPGKTFSTRVEKFVELLIGNAGGINITFNGKKVENIGKPGQVVRLRLPRSESPEEQP